jgi:uncharacterized membrane protein YphA (DoxX/SURF4 family)
MGLWTRLIAVLFAIEMIFGIVWRYPAIKFQVLMLVIFIAIFCYGAGRFSLDRMIGKEF